MVLLERNVTKKCSAAEPLIIIVSTHRRWLNGSAYLHWFYIQCRWNNKEKLKENFINMLEHGLFITSIKMNSIPIHEN